MSAITVIVEDPKNEGFGPTKHTTYKITCTGGSDKASARHRFSAFVTLRTDMLDLLPGVVVPPLPEKQVMNRFSAEFIEKRREMLCVFLQRIADHPLAANCEKVHAFCSWPEGLRSVAATRYAAFQLPPLQNLDVGDPLRDASKMMGDFEKQIGAVRDVFKRMQARQNDEGNDLQELSSGIKSMADNPMNAVLAIALNPFSSGLQGLAKHTKVHAVGTKQNLLAKLKLHRMLALAMIEQFKGRDKLSKEIDTANSKVKDVLQQSTKLAGKAGKEKQLAESEAKAEELKSKIEALKSKYSLFTQTLVWELEQYNKTKNREILASLQEYALTFTDFTSNSHSLWGGLTASVMQSVNKVTSEAASLGEALAPAPPPQSPPVQNLSQASSSSSVTAAQQATSPSSPRSSFSAPPQPPVNQTRESSSSSFGQPPPTERQPSTNENPFGQPTVAYEAQPAGGSLSAALWGSNPPGGGGS